MAIVYSFRKLNTPAMLLLLFLFSSMAGCAPLKASPQIPSPIVTSEATPTTIGLPDLTIKDIHLEVTPEDICSNEQPIYPVFIEIVNQGKSDAGPFAIAINKEPLRYFSGLPAKETLEFLINSASLEINTSIDPESKVKENNETNNILTVELSLPFEQPTCNGPSNGSLTTISPVHTLDGHTDKVLSVDFSPDGDLVASGSVDNTLRLWRVVQGSLLRTMRGHPFPVLSTKFSPNGAILATGSTDGTIRIWRVSDGKLLRELHGHAGHIKSLDISNDGRYLVSCADDFTVRLWLMNSYRLIQTIDEGMLDITSVTFSPDSKAIAWSEIDGTIRVRLISGSWLYLLNETPIAANSVVFDPQEEWIGAGFADGSVRLWKMSNSNTDQILKSHTKAITDLEFSPDGKWLATASTDGTIHLWERGENGFGTTPLLIYSGHISGINSISFSPDGNQIVSASDDYSLRIWDVPQD